MKKSVRVSLVVVAAVALCVCVPLGVSRAKKSSAYKQAVALCERGEAEEAYRIFSSLGGFSDSEKRLSSLVASDFLLPFRAAEKGSIVQCGACEQDGDEADGSEPIDWILLDRIDGEVLLLSLDCLDARPYNPVPFAEITWEHCALRSYLNGEFFENSFSPQEKGAVFLTQNQNDDQSEVGTAGGADTLDKIFLLSEAEYAIYINDALSREDVGKAYPSQLALQRGAKTGDDGCAFWWLRSPGVYGYSAQFVTDEGKLYPSGAYVDNETNYAVRPAMWVRAGKM